MNKNTQKQAPNLVGNGEKKQQIQRTDKELLVELIKIAKPFKKYFILSLFLNAGFAILSAASIAVIQPVLQVIFPDSGTGANEATNTATEPSFFTGVKDTIFGSLRELVQDPDPIGMLLNISMLIVFLFLFKNIFRYFNSLNGVKLEEGIIKSVRDKLFAKYTTLSISYFQKNKQGDIVSTVTNDVTQLNSATVRAFNVVFRELIQVVIFLLMLLALSPQLTLVSFAASGGGLILIRVAKKYLKRYSSRMQQAMANFTSTLSESVAGIKLIKAYNAQKVSGGKFEEETNYYVSSSLKHRKVVALIPSVYEMIAIFALCFVLYMGGSKVLVEGTMSSSDLLTFLFLLFSIMAPLTILINNIAEMQRGLVATERVMKVLDLEPNISDGDKELKGFDSSIDINNLSFAYETGTDVLKDISLSLKKGEKIAFVGSSGSGKSTMLDLILRFYDPYIGSINIDGHNIKDLELESYLKHFGVVSQENILFNDNVRNNVLFGASHISDEEIWKALKIANAYEFVNRLPDGLDTLLGERGTTISGGERQRLAIARAIIRKPEILVFDEATSALDAESEHIVQSAINDSLAGRTAIIVAHRLATITSCDRIYVFDKGEIVEKGTHGELIEGQGIYRTLYDMQSLDKEAS